MNKQVLHLNEQVVRLAASMGRLSESDKCADFCNEEMNIRHDKIRPKTQEQSDFHTTEHTHCSFAA